MSKGSRPECFGRFACETPARAPFGLRPAPRRLPPQFMNPNCRCVDLVFFMVSKDRRSRARFAKNVDLLAELKSADKSEPPRARRSMGLPRRGRHSGATCALEVATEDATRPGLPCNSPCPGRGASSVATSSAQRATAWVLPPARERAPVELRTTRPASQRERLHRTASIRRATRRPAAGPADAREARERAADRRGVDLRAEVGRVPRARVPRRRRGVHPEPRREAARPLLPRARRPAARAAP